jgi:predicted Zn-dependent peptidase
VVSLLQVFEDIGQQLIYDDKYISPTEVCAMIDAVTSEDLNRVAAKVV